jgi:hypothetical protein
MFTESQSAKKFENSVSAQSDSGSKILFRIKNLLPEPELEPDLEPETESYSDSDSAKAKSCGSGSGSGSTTLLYEPLI